MTATIRLPGTLRGFADGKKAVEVQNACVGDAIRELCVRYSAIGQRVLDENGAPRRFVNVYVNGEDIRLLQGQDTPLHDGDEVILAPAVAGGA